MSALSVVVDSSVLIAAMTDTTALGADARDRIDHAQSTHLPHGADLEVLHVLRGLWLRGVVDDEGASYGLAAYRAMRLVRHPHEDLLARIWQLRGSVTAYDAAFVALAEALDVPMLTADVRLLGANGPRSKFEVLC